MQFKDLFRVPKGEKVTEKHLRRVLAASICSILLCMSCLLGTTWAWFTVSVENTENVIKIGPDVMLTAKQPDETSKPVYSGDPLTEEHNLIAISRIGVDDSFQKQRKPVYVTLTLRDGTNSASGYIVLTEQTQTVVVYATVGEQLFWSASWVEPDNVALLKSSDALDIPSPAADVSTQETEAPTQPTEDSTQSTEEATQSTVETTSETENTEATEDPSQSTTDSETES